MKLFSKVILLSLLAIPMLARLACTGQDGSGAGTNEIKVITSIEHFNTILESSGARLLAFDLYADWCMPCHVLTPTLDEIAREHKEKVTLYKVDTDKFPQITAAFGTTGIPFVVFVKNQRAVYALLGVQPKDTYARIIETYSDTNTTDYDSVPQSKPIDGLRVGKIRSEMGSDRSFGETGIGSGKHAATSWAFKDSPVIIICAADCTDYTGHEAFSLYRDRSLFYLGFAGAQPYR